MEHNADHLIAGIGIALMALWLIIGFIDGGPPQ